MPTSGVHHGQGPSYQEDRERLIEDLEEILERHPPEPSELRDRIRNVPAEDIASILSELDPDRKLRLIRTLSHDVGAQVLDETDRDSKLAVLDSIGIDTLSQMVDTLPPDEGVDLLALLDSERRRQVLDRVDPELAKNLRELEKFDPETAGGLMTNDFLMVDVERQIGDVLREIGEVEDEVPLAYVYVVDELRNLLGVASVKQLLRADEEERVDQVMQKAWITVPPGMDREEVARIVDRYHLAAIPVTDDRGSLLGVVTVDDVMDVLEEEVSEDMYRLAGTGMHDPFSDSVLRRIWFRLPWLTITMLGGFVSVAIIGRYESTIREFEEVAFFIPIIGALAGNVGVQASTIMVRGFATGDIPVGGRLTWNLLIREMMVGVAIGCICGIATGMYAAVFAEAEAMRFGISVGLSIFGAISAAAAVGTIVPLACSKIGVDPALAAGPFIVTVIDIFAHLIYFVVLGLILLSALRVS